MRRLAIAMLSAAVVASLVPDALAETTSAGVTVSPRTGTPATRFRVRFTSPQPTGMLPGVRVWETVIAAGPAATGGCSAAARRRVRPAGVNARVGVRLWPTGSRWCPGRYTGAVTLYRATRCKAGPIGPSYACPLVVFAPERLGRFRFTVRRASGAPGSAFAN